MRLAGQSSFLVTALLLLGGAVRDGDANHTLEVKCESKSGNLTVKDNWASYQCEGESNQEPVSVQMDADFQVNVEADKLTLLLTSSNVVSLNFTGNGDLPTLVNTRSDLSFVDFSNLKNLTFRNVVFEADIVHLQLQNATSEIHFNNSTLSDLSLPNYDIGLTVIDMNETPVKKFPTFLYERILTNNMNVTVDLSSISEENTTLTAEQLNNLKANLGTLYEQPWAQYYNSWCTNSTNSTASPDVAGSASGASVVSCELESSSSSTASSKDAGSPNGDIAIASSSSSGSGSADAGHSSNSGVSTGVLVVIIIVVVVIAAVLAFFILRMYFKRKAANANSQNEATATLMSKGDTTADKGSFISNDEFLRNFRLPQSDVSLVKSVGTGRLWVGEYNDGKVIVKRVESEVTDSFVTKALMAQARTFATISHPNITNLVGVTWLAGTDFAVVTEFMDKGNLKTVLTNTGVDLDVSTKLQMCLDVALALSYLHETEQNLCVKQLSSRKVLVNKAMSCKLSLFECVPSSAKLGGPSTAATYSYGMGEVAWLPPEVITRSSPMDARKKNMFAFGVLVSEIFTRVSPYQSLIEELGNTMSDVELVKRVRRQDPLVPHEDRKEFLEAPASVRQLVEQCLSYAPMSRPTAKDLVEILHSAKEELATNSI